MKHPKMYSDESGSLFRTWGFRNSTGRLVNHRLHGPAIEYSNGQKSWFLYGELVAMQTQGDDDMTISITIHQRPHGRPGPLTPPYP